MSLKQLLPSILLLFIFAVGYLNLSNKLNEKKTSVVNLEKLYNSFDLTQETNAKFKKLTRNRMSAIDSINVMITKLKNQGTNVSQVMSSVEQLTYQTQLLNKENENIKLELEHQVWNQLNQYLNEFGKANEEYSIILGAMGDGSIIYAEELIDITEDAISFVNDKYNGLN